MSSTSPRRLWPILSVLTASLLGLLGIEQYARERGNGALVIAIRQGASPTTDEDGDPEMSAEAAPAVSPAHAEARAATRRGEADRAVALYRAEVEAHQDDPALRRELSAALISAGRLSEAKVELQALAESRPSDPKIATLYGALLRRMGELEAAERQLRRAIELAPSGTEARVALGALLVRGKRWSEALAVLEPCAKVGGNRESGQRLVLDRPRPPRGRRRRRGEGGLR